MPSRAWSSLGLGPVGEPRTEACESISQFVDTQKDLQGRGNSLLALGLLTD